MASTKEHGLLVISSEDAPEVGVLKDLPEQLPVLAIGRTLEELSKGGKSMHRLAHFPVLTHISPRAAYAFQCRLIRQVVYWLAGCHIKP